MNGGVIHAVTHPNRSSVSLSLQEADTPGIYTCAIPDENRKMREVNFGVYPIGFNSELTNFNKFSISILRCTCILRTYTKF